MALQDKYRELIDAARAHNAADLQVREQDNVLYIDGKVQSEESKRKLWDIYNRIDPDYRSADLVMNLQLADGAFEEYEVKRGDSLSEIGERYGVAWKQIYEANRDLIKNPDLIRPGWKLKIPRKS